jgi:hypothetical protein
MRGPDARVQKAKEEGSAGPEGGIGVRINGRALWEGGVVIDGC